jgi:hypothetical protein
MNLSRLLSVVALLSFTAGTSAAAKSTDALLSCVKKDRPAVRWDTKSIVVADFDGDGRPDSAVLGYERDKLLLAVHVGHAGSPASYFEFSINRGVQAAVCTAPVKLETSALECNSGEGELPGCKSSPGASVLSIIDGECDSIHLYWNHTLSRMQWWRR